ncbi:Ornithine carbamoyltransferase [Candidatus Burkholderia humilis]|nr:Ornithine carbamoyltransferase [Candidatus Burkholderia humilis]
MKGWINPEAYMSLAEYQRLVGTALAFKSVPWERKNAALRGRAVYFMFFNQSLRTRSSFQTRLAKLGVIPVVLDPHTGIYTPASPGREIPYATERISDVARVLSEYGDAIAIRMYGEPAGWVYGEAHRAMLEFAEWSKIPIINMECDMFHPCQALADMMTIREKFGPTRRKIVISWAYSGSWHKPVAVPQSTLLASANRAFNIVLAHPEGFELDEDVVQLARAKALESGGTLTVSHDFEEALVDADVVYAKSWCSLQHLAKRFGDAVNEAAMTVLFERNRHWIFDSEKRSGTAPNSIYMHCLPADRGQEVTDEVIDGDRSAVFAQASNRIHAQNAAMVRLLNPGALE